MHYTIGRPVEHRRGKWRCLVSFAGRRRWGPLATSPAKAEREAEDMARNAISGALTVADMIDAYLSFLRSASIRESSITTARHQLCRFFGQVTDKPVEFITPGKAAALYETLRVSGLAIATHRSCLVRAKGLFEWGVQQRLVRRNPVVDVKPIGVAERGKAQLRFDEARRLVALCVVRATDGDDGALAVLMALLMGLRASEIATRTVRDLDDGGALLWIDAGFERWRPKTRAGQRMLEVPAVLRPLLKDRAHGKPAGALLFEAPRASGRRSRNWVRSACRRLCRAAEVPLVCAHGLRGQHATIAIQAGATPHIVAGALGHASPSTTVGCYALPGSEQTGLSRQATRSLLN